MKNKLSKQEKNKRIYFGVKRLLDILISILALIVLLPLFIIIAILIKVDSKGTVFYKHKRLGKNGKYIYIYKFRSMYKDADIQLNNLLKNKTIRSEWERNFKLDEDSRITRVGKFLRVTSIDELPQLLNIIIGDMSIIGPRPIIDEELNKYGKNKELLLSIRPGLTGWWACNGRSCTSYEERINLELYYVKNCSILLDLKCILKTIIAVIKKSGAQ